MHLHKPSSEQLDPSTAGEQTTASRDVLNVWPPSSTRHLWLMAAVAGIAFAALSMGLDLWLLKTERWPAVSASLISHGIFAVIVAVLVYQVLAYGRERRERIVQRLATIDEMNHHIRNALQVISFSARAAPGKEWQLEEINQAVNRIQWALREIVPKLEPEFAPFEGSARQRQEGKPAASTQPPDETSAKK
jgi:two-component sensor histidine kinase